MGPAGSFLGASWRPLGGLLGPLGGLWGLLGGLFGRPRAFLARLTPSGAVLGALVKPLTPRGLVRFWVWWGDCHLWGPQLKKLRISWGGPVTNAQARGTARTRLDRHGVFQKPRGWGGLAGGIAGGIAGGTADGIANGIADGIVARARTGAPNAEVEFYQQFRLQFRLLFRLWRARAVSACSCDPHPRRPSRGAPREGGLGGRRG